MRTVVHEMRNQLAVAIANLEAFVDGKLRPTPERLVAVLQALNELDVLIGDLHEGETSTEHIASDLRIANVCAVISNEAMAMEARAAEKGIHLSVAQCGETHEGCRGFVCDPVRVGEVVNNLLTNAIRYTPPGGAVHVDCHREPGVLALCVSDNGPGIPPSERERVFEPGFRGSSAGASSGSGMGLSVVREIVDQHGGTVEIEGRPEGGVTFVVHLPGDISDPLLPRVLSD